MSPRAPEGHKPRRSSQELLKHSNGSTQAANKATKQHPSCLYAVRHQATPQPLAMQSVSPTRPKVLLHSNRSITGSCQDSHQRPRK
eukprot:12885887-Prorocentrum_lima.AAC.1